MATLAGTRVATRDGGATELDEQTIGAFERATRRSEHSQEVSLVR